MSQGTQTTRPARCNMFSTSPYPVTSPLLPQVSGYMEGGCLGVLREGGGTQRGSVWLCSSVRDG